MKRLLLAAALLAPLSAQAHFAPMPSPSPRAPSFPSAVQDLIKQGVDKIVGDLTTMDTVAGAIDPNSTAAPPDNVWNPYAHACVAPAVAWLKSWPSPSAVPKPTGPGGVLTAIVVAGAKLQATQEFVAKLTADGVPPAVHIACDPFVMWIMRLPASVQANLGADLANFVTLFQKQ